MSSLYFQIGSLFYIILLLIIFFSKKRLKSLENKIFSIMIVANFIGVLLDIVSTYLAIIDANYFWLILFCKLYLVYLLVWISLMTLYIFEISNYKVKKRLNRNIWLTVTTAISTILILVLPLYSNRDNGLIYTYGPSATISYIISGLCVFTWLICMFKNYKNLKSKKYLPMFAYLTIGLAATFIQATRPELLIITSMETFITFLMYHTIENPDMKLIAQLNEARDQAERANNAKSDFLSNMSHEIRTPLNAIVGFSQALEEEDIPDNAKEEVKDIISASQSLLEIVNGILDISKIEANKIEIVNGEYNFYDVLNDLVALTKARMGDKALDFRTNFDPTIPHVLYGDKTRIKQVILNLLTNSVKYTKEGYIEFKVSSVQKDDVCRLIISVEDSGIGIKQENIDKLFSKFERFDLEKNITIEGTGLGLAITKRLVELMNGRIVVQSVYGKGSRFTIAVDQKIVDKQELDVPTEVTSDEVLDLTGKKILLVDDNTLNLKVASRLLEKYKADITTLTRGADCIEKIKSGEKFDLILLDDMMPGMSGVETLKNLKQIDGFNIPTIALTANAITGMREKYLSEGFDDYLSKPIEKPELNRVIQKFMEQK